MAKTFEELFKALNDFNDSRKAIVDSYLGSELRIYIDDVKFYEGTSYVHFYEKLKQEYLDEVVDRVLNIVWNEFNTLTIRVYTLYGESDIKVEVYII